VVTWTREQQRPSGIALLALATACAAPRSEAPRPWREAALEAGAWLERSALATEHGRAWPAVPEVGAEVDRSLYAGSPGVVLFLLELAHATGDERWGALARAGAEDLLATLPEKVEGPSAGLYTGVAGVGCALGESWRATGDERFRRGLERCVELLARAAQPEAEGLSWGSCNDVISGNAGIGFFLAWARERLGDERSGRLAAECARALVPRGEPSAAGLDWPMEPSFPRRMPNFSHGTAGVVAFLARAGASAATIDAARRGAAHLVAIADRSDGGLRIHHHSPDGLDLFYYGWCHGPCGTARAFRELFAATGDPLWSALELACARSVLESGLPERRLSGFWDNVSRCCGSAGVIEFLLELAAEHPRGPYLAFARRVAEDLVERGTRDELGLRWVQAEHRVRPELLQAQTGLMQGAAGIGLALLRLDALERGVPALVRLPDEPRSGSGPEEREELRE